ncbi:MAG: hypothetical protein RI928_141 [Pseudomonadota bacterium]|jgi:ElaB/YqjD/DUF883 family membrane-anchored ribosome-binding protein
METEIPISSTESSGGRQDIRSRSSQIPGLRDELSHLKNDLDALMLHASTLSESELREARDRIMAKFSSMRHAAKGIAEQASRHLNLGREATADYVRERPLQSILVAAGMGLLIGALLRRD